MIKNLAQGSSIKAGDIDKFSTGDRSKYESEIEGLMPYLPLLNDKQEKYIN